MRALDMETDDSLDLEGDDTRSMTFLNASGDGTLAWGPGSDDAMRALIERKMKEGFAFFIVERRLGGLVRRKVRVTDVEKAAASRAVTLSDADFAAMVSSGAAQLVHTPGRDSGRGIPMGGGVMSRDPAAVAAAPASYAVRAMRGG